MALMIIPIVSLTAMIEVSASNNYESQITYTGTSPGESIFKKYCVTCHQADAGGVPNLTPPLIKTTYVLGDKERLIKIILNGFNENIEIEGEYFSNPMPALNILKDQEIADVLTYVRNNFGNKASAVSASEVKAVRDKIK